jgi:5-methylcytosine-specific restriction endonuclease McrA
MSASRTWKPLLKEPVASTTKTIKWVAKLFSKTNIRPVYQREIRWSQDNMCLFVTHILRNGILNGSIMLYTLQPTERPAGSEWIYECVDGQHRIFTAYHYINSLPVELPGKKPFLVYARNEDEDTGDIQHVFFKETDATRAYVPAERATVAYLTEETEDDDGMQETFCDYPVDVKQIQEAMTLGQRRDLFLAAQRGVAVRGSDLLKNHVNHSLIRYISETRAWEPVLKGLIKDRLTVAPMNYWLHWAIRLYFITSTDPLLETMTTVDRFTITDHEIGKRIKDKRGAPSLNPEDDQLLAFGAEMDRFMAFLSRLPSKVKFSPCHFYALYAHLAGQPDERMDELLPLLRSWSEDPETIRQKKAWESRAIGGEDAERAGFFEQNLASLDALTCDSASDEEPAPRKSLKKLRAPLWEEHFGSCDATGSCALCNIDLAFTDKWDVSHVVPWSKGGSDDLANLRVNCSTCNKETGTKHMGAVKKTKLPHKPSLLACGGAGCA